MLDSHKRAVFHASDPENYLKRPEVWADVKTCLSGMIELHPNVYEYRTDYLDWALRCNQVAEVARESSVVRDLRAALNAKDTK